MKKVVAFLFAWMFLFVLIGCKENDSEVVDTADTPVSLTETTDNAGVAARCTEPVQYEVPVDWADFIKVNGIKYLGDWRETEVSADCIGEKIGEVTCGVPKVYTDGMGNTTSSEPENGAAYLCDVGTELFAVTDRENAIAALVDGKYYLYTEQ